MNFKERFKGKMEIVNRKGLKQAIFRDHEPVSPQMRPLFRPVKSHSLDFKTISATPRLFLTRSVSKSSAESYLQSDQKLRKRNSLIMEPGIRKKQPMDKYIDQMMQKHQGILRLLEKKTSYRVSNSNC